MITLSAGFHGSLWKVEKAARLLVHRLPGRRLSLQRVSDAWVNWAALLRVHGCLSTPRGSIPLCIFTLFSLTKPELPSTSTSGLSTRSKTLTYADGSDFSDALRERGVQQSSRPLPDSQQMNPVLEALANPSLYCSRELLRGRVTHFTSESAASIPADSAEAVTYLLCV